MQDIDTTIRENLGLVWAQLKKLNVLFDQDAESIGYEALYRAAATYDVKQGYKFSTYATCCIYNALGSYIRTLNKKRKLNVISYNSIAYCEDNVNHEFIELFASDVNVAEELERCELICRVQQAYNDVYNKLAPGKQRDIISVWHGSGYEMSNKEVARLIGVSQPYVNQVINTFKNKIKKKLEDYHND